MKAAVQTEVGRIELQELPDPIPGWGEVVVRVRAALTCGTDAKLFRRGHPKIAFPVVAGHEFSGEIAAVGPAVDKFCVGDAVMVGLSGPCGECPWCRRGFSNLCPVADGERVWGAFAEMVRLPRRVVEGNVHLKPSSLSFEEAAMLDPLASVVHGYARLGASADGTLLVLGLGPLGLLWVACAPIFRFQHVVALGKGEHRLEIARRLGAEAVDVTWENAAERVHALVRLGGAAAVAECVGTCAAWQEAVEYAAPGGRVVFFGGCAAGTRVSFETGPIHYGELSLLGSFHYRPDDVTRAARMLVEREVNVKPLLSGTARLQDVQRLLDQWGRADAIKTVVEP